MRAAIQVDRLRKSYGSHVVLNGLNFCVRQGEIFALLGVNGAGKTTALECIEGLRKFDEGSIVINGQMGIQLQSASLPAHIRPLEAVKMFAKWNRTVPDKAMAGCPRHLRICEKTVFSVISRSKTKTSSGPCPDTASGYPFFG